MRYSALLFLSLVFKGIYTENNVTAPSRSSNRCIAYSCVSEQIDRQGTSINTSEAAEECNLPELFIHAIYFRSFETGEIPAFVLKTRLEFLTVHYCHMCEMRGIFKYYMLHTRSLYNTLIHSYRNKGSLLRILDAGHYLFRLYFSFFSIPAGLITNWINFSIMRQMLGDKPGGALYFHAAEIVIDVVSNLWTSLRNTEITSAFSGRMYKCTNFKFMSCHREVGTLIQNINQLIVAALVADRLDAIENSFKYTNANHKRRFKKMLLLIILGACLVYFPRVSILCYGWGDWFDTFQFNSIFDVLYGFIFFAPLLAQAVLSWKLQTAFKRWQAGRHGQQELQRIRQEKQKKMLLIGVVGLNFVMLSLMYLGRLFSYLALKLMTLAIKTNSPQLAEIAWHMFDAELYMNTAQPVLIFLNGSAALFLHVLCSTGYRKAFKKTALGRAMWPNASPANAKARKH